MAGQRPVGTFCSKQVGDRRHAERVRREPGGKPAALSRRFIMRQMSMAVIAFFGELPRPADGGAEERASFGSSRDPAASR